MRPAPRPTRRAISAAALLTLAALSPPSGARAQAPAAASSPASAPASAPAPTPAPTPAALGLWDRPNLLGDMGGLRPLLDRAGLSLGLSETSEVQGNATGGIRRAVDYQGLTLLGLGLDTSKAFGWDGGTFNVSAFQIHGRNLNTDALLALQLPSSIQAERSTRLWEIWYQQSALGGHLDIKIGQQSLDQEFMISTGSSLLINSAMGWPLTPAADLYAGGPAYPLSSLGVRLRGTPTDTITLLGGVFDDNPPGGPFTDDSQIRGAEQSGTAFNLHTGALIIAEAQFALNAAAPADGGPAPAQPNPAAINGLGGTYKFGFWYDTGRFPDQRFDTAGLPLASPASTGLPRLLSGNYSLYAVADQAVWRPDPNAARTLAIFGRLMGAPGDRNLISLSLTAGVALKAPFAGRDNDTFGIGYGYGHISGAAAAADKDARDYGGNVPVRSAEQFVEATYQAQIAPWWFVQPDVQYIINPGGGVANPLDPAARIRNELVLGVRTNVVF